MRPDPLLDPSKFPTYLLLSVAVSAAIGLIIWRVSGNPWLAGATGVFLFAGDYVGLKWLLGRDDR
jgi:hypothetical protein